MKSLVQGVHHITLCPGGAQQDIDFFTQVLGQRLVKQTVLMDGNIPIYHFYYGNADADVGSIATCFPYSRKPGRAGSGQLSCTSYTVPNGAIAFWKEHFDRHRAEHSGVQERFGTKYLRVQHPAGLLFEMIEESGDTRNPWTTTADPTRRRDARLLWCGAVGARRARTGIVLRRRARAPEGRRRWSLPPIRNAGNRSWTHHRPARRAGARAWQLGLWRRHGPSHRVQRRDRRRPGEAEGRLRGTRVTRTLRRSRIASTSTPCMCARPAASSSSAPRMSLVDSSRMRRRTNSGRRCSCRRGSRTNAPRSSRSWSPSRYRKKTGQSRERRRHRGLSSPHTRLRATSRRFLCLITRPRSTRINSQHSDGIRTLIRAFAVLALWNGYDL